MCLDRAIALGGHARVGFENAILDENGALAQDNGQRVALVAEIARKHGRRLSDGNCAAKILGLHRAGTLIPTPSSYLPPSALA